MTSNIQTVSPEATVDEVEALMSQLRVRHIPVVEDDGEIHGMISIRDVSRYHTESLKSSLVRQSEDLGRIKNHVRST